MTDFTTSAGIAATAIALANIIVWAFGLTWSPQQKAGVGAIAALAVFVMGLVLFPAAWSDGPTAFSTLFYALLTVLAAAGAPVFRDVIRGVDGEMDGMDAAEYSGDGRTRTNTDGHGRRRWEGWNR